ncbi:flagellin domain protein [Desulfarculus baarsii DSM 2075]|uniref:Flagellin n=1 Tax=Desulfarculus baarsii (strain ATCC 33931 / DSM 2075 / LMG 7858 / VKM B-1802 / 2st14) TaxID=644282 RepID=E1QJH4_DESB2|nr:flagellin [Desulfarculus baarsii]ADK85717.1 flagellin domain protein [Desulfarculus baarsii DSM 2075]
MSLYINHNMMASNAARNLSNVYGDLATSVQRLSSGLRINSAADDAAGLAVREMMRADVAALNQGIRNASDAISMIQTAEGAMSVIDEKLIRMKELAEQAATGTYTTAQRLIMDSEYQAMAAEIDRIANATDFNGIKLLDGSLLTQHDGSGLKVHFGTGNEAAEDYYYVSIGDMKATSITGLQVGGGAGEGATWRTTGLDMAASTDAMANNGTFGIQTSTDGTTWSNYGFLTVDAGDTLDDVVDKVNAGNAATNSITFAAGSSSTDLAGDTITVNGHAFTFSTGTSTSTANTIGIQNLGSVASIAAATQFAINTWASVGNADGVYATINATASSLTVNLTDRDFGASTDTLASSNTTLTLGGATFSGGGTDTTSVTASAVADADGSGYELQLTGGTGVQVRLVQTNGAAFTASTATVGGTPTTGTTVSSMALNTGAAAYVSDWADGDEDSEWFSIGSTGPTWDGAHIQTQSAAQLALAQIDAAISKKDTARASLGSTQNRLENTITNLQIQAENLQAAESRISDVDVALEMTEFTRNNILTQAAVSMLAQANSLPSLALSLLGG